MQSPYPADNPRLWLLGCLLCCLLAAPFAAQAATTYVIVLASAPGSNLDWKPEQIASFAGRRLFVTRIAANNESRERLNLGFFDSYEQAAALLPGIREHYPGAWISPSGGDEPVRYIDTATAPAAEAKPAAGTPAGIESRPSDEQLDSLMARAKSEFSQQNYPQAIRLFTAIVQAEQNRYSQEALELLGLSRQRNAQNAHAFDIYTRYLETYPQGDGPDRVRQRLSALITETRAPRERIRMSSDKGDREFISYGSWSQIYRRDRTSTDDTGTLTVYSRLFSFIDLTAIQRSAGISHKARFTADDTQDFLADSDSNEFRFIEMYYELAFDDSGTSARLGRQSQRLGGILRRFDGISAGYRFTPDLRLNLLAGYPVEIDNKSSINSDRKFYGFTFETGTFLEHWNLNFFHFQQYIHDLDDVSSNGAEVRYVDNTKSFYGMVDYDYIYGVFNIVQFNANLNLLGGRSLYLNAYMQKNPLLTTTNALIGRQETSIEELQQTLNIEQIRQLALDRSANSQTMTFGGTQPINEKFRVTSDITLTRTGGTVASGGVEATPVAGPDYFLNLQLAGDNLLQTNDTGVLGLRYRLSDPSDTLSLIANARFPITRDWRINPRVQYDIRRLAGGRSQDKWRTLVRTDYRYLKSVRLDLELGYDDTSENTNGESSDSSDLYFSLGYRWDF